MKTNLNSNPLRLVGLLLLICFAFLHRGVGQVTHTTDAVPAAIIVPGSEGNVIYKLQITSMMPVQATGISFNTSGTYAAADLKTASFIVTWYNFSLDTDEIIGTATSTSIGLGGENINIIFTPGIFIDFFGASISIKANLSPSAVAGHTIKMDGLVNPVTINYLSMGPPVPINVVNNQTDLAGLQTIGTGGGITPASLIANYTFCNNANDVSGNSNNGTVNGATLTSDRFNNANSAYSFDGVDDYIEVADNSVFHLGTNDFTTSIWFKSSSSNLTLALYSKIESLPTKTGISAYLNYPFPGNLRALTNVFGTTETAGTYNDGSWHLLTFTRKETVSKIYVDGILKNTKFNTNPFDVTQTTSLIIGRNSSIENYFDGQLDDFKIYSGALTDAEVLAKYAEENTTPICTPVVCPAITVAIGVNFSRTCDGQATFTAFGGIESYSYSIVEGTGGSIDGISLSGLGTYTIQATDANGCTGTVSVTLTNNDNVAPTFTNCPSNITETADANCTKVVTWPALDATDNCECPTIPNATFLGVFEGHTYYKTNGNETTWASSKAIANSYGGKLATINSAAENTFLSNVNAYGWIGLNDQVNEGTYVWDSGEPLNYINWNSAEPDNFNNQDFVFFYQGTWHDDGENSVRPIIIEVSCGVTVTQTEGPVSGSAYPIGTTPVSFEVTDAAGNKSTCSFTVTVNPSVTAELSYTSTAFCTNSGEKTATISGPTGGSFSVTPNMGLTIDAETGTINTLNATPGNYTITYTIAASGTCPSITDNFAITINAAPVISCPLPMEVCKNEAVFNLPSIPEGATVTVGGVTNTTGTFDPSANWSAFNDGDANASVPVVYTLTNTNGCTSTCSFSILVKRLPNAFSSIVPEVNGLINGQTVSICKNSTETVNMLFGGGTGSMAPFTFTYTLNEVPQPDLVANAAVGGLAISTANAGSFVYHLTKVKINTGCEMAFDVTATINILETPEAPSASPTQPTCIVGTGSITVNTTATSYSFDDGATFQPTATKSGLNPDTYKVKIKDANGCVSAATTIIIEQQPGTPDAPTISIAQPSCFVSTGTISIDNPVAGYEYFLNGNAFNNGTSTVGNQSTTYQVYARNAAGCLSAPTDAVVNAQPATPLAPEGGTVIHPTCLLSTGSISIEGITGVTYSYNGGTSYTGSNVSEQLPAGDYIVKIKSDVGGCESEGAAYTINPQPASPDAPTLSQTPANCSSSTGSITVTAPIGTGLIYKLDEGTYQSGLTFNSVSTGSHNVTLKNAAGCTAFTTISVGSDLQAPTVTVPADLSVCVGSPEITLTGGLPAGGTYSGNHISNGIFNTNTPGVHTITYTVTGINGCVASNSFTINVKPRFSVEVQITSALSVCVGEPAGFQFVANGASQGTTGFLVAYNIGGGPSQIASTSNGIAPVLVNTSNEGTITYNFISANTAGGCPSTTFGNLTFTVKAKPIVECPVDVQAATTDPIIVLGSTGTYSGTGVSLISGNYQFNPANAGAGVHEITHTILGENGCSASCTFNITVTATVECTATASISYPVVSNCASGASITPTFVGTSGGQYAALPVGLNINATSGIISPIGSTPGDYVVSYTIAATNDCPAVVATASISILAQPTLGSVTVGTVCQPLPAPLSFTGLVPGTNEITVTLSPTDTNVPFLPVTFTVTADASGNASYDLPLTSYGTEEFLLKITKVKIVDCELVPTTNHTATFTKKPKGGGTGVNITNETVCMGANLSATITGVQNANFAQEVTYKIVNLADNLASDPITVTVPMGMANTLTLSIVAPSVAGSYKVVITAMYITDCGSTTNLMANFTVSADPVVGIPTVIQPTCANPTGTITVSATTGFMYSFDSGLSFGISNNSGPLQPGVYTVLVKNATGCLSESVVIELVEATDCPPSEVICTTTQNGYGNINQTVCDENGNSVSVGSLMTTALVLSGNPKIFGLPNNNRTFTLSTTDLSSNIYQMLSGVSNASSKFGLGGASYGVTSTWPRVPLTNTGKIANNLFAHSMALFFNLQNSVQLDNVALNSPILHTESTLNCGSSTGSGVVSSYQLPTSVVNFLNNPANNYAPTVAGLFQLNNDALGGKTNLPNLSTLATAADKVNKAFNGCRLLAGQPANTQTFGTNIRVKEGNNAFDAPAKGGLYMTLIEGEAATGHILGVVDVNNMGQTGFAPILNNGYQIIMGTDPEGSRIPKAPVGYRIVSQVVTAPGENSFAAVQQATGTGQVAIGNYNSQAGARMAAGTNYQIEFTLEPTAPLPVRLISFTGIATTKGNELNWTVASETNFSHYEVERSVDPKTFEMIGKVSGAGNTNEKLSYNFVDDNLKSNQFSIGQPNSNAFQSTSQSGAEVLFYRLRMVDLDGKYDFSKTIAIKTKSETKYNVYPNPATDFVTVENLDGYELIIRVLDGFGREIISQTKSSGLSVKVPLIDISTGTYFIQIQTPKQIIYRKVIVNK